MAQIIYFSTLNCAPCSMFKPIVQGVAGQTGVSVQFVDAKQNAALAQQFQITSVPAIVIADGSKTLYRNVGILSKSQLTSLFNQYK